MIPDRCTCYQTPTPGVLNCGLIPWEEEFTKLFIIPLLLGALVLDAELTVLTSLDDITGPDTPDVVLVDLGSRLADLQ